MQGCVQENTMLRQLLGVVSCLLYLLLFSHLSQHTGKVKEVRTTVEDDTFANVISICYTAIYNVIMSHRNCFGIGLCVNFT